MNSNISIPNLNQKSSKNPLKFPSLGLFVIFKTIFETILSMFKYAFRGLKFITIDVLFSLYNLISGGVNHTYQSAKNAVQISEKAKEKKKKSILNQDISELFQNSIFVKKRMKKLEAKKALLIEELKGEGAIRTKEPQVYKFIAKNKKGIVENGILNGYSKLEINTFLVQEGYDVYSIVSDKWTEFLYGENSFFAPKMKTKDLLFWLTQLSTYIRSGLTLTDSIKILANQMGKNKTQKRAMQSIIYELTMGESFSKALEKQGTMFPALLINMIKAAEATGELEETLTDMTNYYDEINKTHKQMVSALTYPTIIFVFAIAVITFILIYIIPQFVNIYRSSDVAITGFTAFVINSSEFLKNNIVFILIIATTIILITLVAYEKIKAFRKSLQQFAMKMPILGKVIIYNEMTIFAKTFSSLLRNNVYITESINILSKITNNEIYKEIMYNTIDNIVKGEKISTSFKDQWAIPEVAYYMIVTGESTGQLAEMMSKVSSYYQEMHRSIVNSLKSFIEPVIIVLLAVVVGAIILAVIIPMFNLMGSLG